MEKEFVTYEIALKLKELGFDEECLAYFEETLDIHSLIITHYEEDLYLKAPLYQQVIDLFRIKFYFYINIEPTFNKDWQYSIYNLNDGLLFGSKSLYIAKELDYFQAREQAILKSIELCQKEK